LDRPDLEAGLDESWAADEIGEFGSYFLFVGGGWGTESRIGSVIDEIGSVKDFEETSLLVFR
jgi:hypothetical protein